MSGGADSDTLHRFRVSASTRVLYHKTATEFLLLVNLTRDASLSLIDQALNLHMVQLFLDGELAGTGRTLFYALRWLLRVDNSDLPLSNTSRQGHVKCEPIVPGIPVTSEEVLHMCLALLDAVNSVVDLATRARFVCGLLLSFDVYGRTSDIYLARKEELRPPIRGQIGAAAVWTLTLFPITLGKPSKTGTLDDTVITGGSHPSRA